MTDATQSIGILQFALDSIVEQQQTIANNIANEDTPGYQADQVTFAVLVVQRRWPTAARRPPSRSPRASVREPTATTCRFPLK